MLTRLKTRDARLGECYVLFLPWPAEWRDVTKVGVSATYQVAGQIELHSQPVTVNLDLGDGVVKAQWEKLGAEKAAQMPPPVMSGPAVPLNPQPIPLNTRPAAPPPALSPPAGPPGLPLPPGAMPSLPAPEGLPMLPAPGSLPMLPPGPLPPTVVVPTGPVTVEVRRG